MKKFDTMQQINDASMRIANILINWMVRKPWETNTLLKLPISLSWGAVRVSSCHNNKKCLRSGVNKTRFFYSIINRKISKELIRQKLSFFTFTSDNKLILFLRRILLENFKEIIIIIVKNIEIWENRTKKNQLSPIFF